MLAERTNTKQNFYVRFENTKENLALLAYLQTLKNQKFVVFNSPAEVTNSEKEHIRLNAEIDKLSQLKAGWDGFKALKPNKKAINQAEAFVSLLSEKVLKYCVLFSSNDSSVYLQGNFPKGGFAAYLNGERFSYFLKGENFKNSAADIELNDKIISKIENQICKNLI